MPVLLRVVALAALLSMVLFTTAHAGNLQAGIDAYNRGDYAAAVRIFAALAAQGDAGAQFNLGFMYHWGRGVPQDDAEAVQWFHMAATQGHPWAQVNLGVRYHEGRGVSQDDAEAVQWFRKAAEQGNAKGQFNLGRMYDLGRGVPRDRVQAYAWFDVAAAQGDGDAEVFKQHVTVLMTRQDMSRAQQLAREYWNAYVAPFR